MRYRRIGSSEAGERPLEQEDEGEEKAGADGCCQAPAELAGSGAGSWLRLAAAGLGAAGLGPLGVAGGGCRLRLRLGLRLWLGGVVVVVVVGGGEAGGGGGGEAGRGQLRLLAVSAGDLEGGNKFFRG